MRTISKRFTLTHVFALSKHRHSFPRDSSFFLYRFVQLRIDSESILGDREVHGEAPRCSGVSDWSLVVIFPWSSLGRSYRRQAAYAVNPSSGQVINWSHHFENHLYFSFLPNSTTIALQVTQINLIFVWLLRFLNKISNEKISFYTVFLLICDYLICAMAPWSWFVSPVRSTCFDFSTRYEKERYFSIIDR